MTSATNPENGTVTFGRQDNQGYSLPFGYSYGYNSAGRVTAQTMSWSIYNPNNPASPYTENMIADYQWDNEGKMTSTTAMMPPGLYGPTYTYQYDNMRSEEHTSELQSPCNL